jgi:hypothetical protein
MRPVLVIGEWQLLFNQFTMASQADKPQAQGCPKTAILTKKWCWGAVLRKKLAKIAKKS